MQWPSISPDLSIIEHFWDMMGHALRRWPEMPHNTEELYFALVEEWNNIPHTYFQKLYRSMRNRCNIIYRVQGGPTRI